MNNQIKKDRLKLIIINNILKLIVLLNNSMLLIHLIISNYMITMKYKIIVFIMFNFVLIMFYFKENHFN